MMHEEFDHQHEEVLFESNRGFVRCCRACGAIEIRFGNAIIGLRFDEVLSLTETVTAFDDEFRSASRDSHGHATVWLGDGGSGFRFRRDEIAELHRLLAGAVLFAQLTPANPESDSPF